MRDFYYYYKDPDDKRRITVCLLEQGGNIVSRGIAICSEFDNFCRKRGRAIARGRSMKAVVNKNYANPILRPCARAQDMMCGSYFSWKSMPFVSPWNEIETKIQELVANRYQKTKPRGGIEPCLELARQS